MSSHLLGGRDVKEPNPNDPPGLYEADVLDWAARQEVITKIAICTGASERGKSSLNLSTFHAEVDDLFDRIIDPWYQGLRVKRNSTLEDAEKKIREAKVAFEKLSDN